MAGALLATVSCAKEHVPAEDTDKRPDTLATFLNPVKSTGRDPFLTRKDGYYYYMNTDRNYLILSRLQYIEYLPTAYSKTIYVPEEGASYATNISKAELHFLNGKWYIYFSADDGSEANRRVHALENSSADPLLGTWEMKGKVSDKKNALPATEGTVLEYNDQLYFLWSGVIKEFPPADTSKRQIYIAKMENPWTLSSERIMIAEPDKPWEEYSYPKIIFDNKGKPLKGDNGLDSTRIQTERLDQNPQVIKNAQGDVFVTFTAGSCISDDLSIGLLTLKKGGDPLVAANWTKSANPVFAAKSNGTFGPGFNSFFKSADDKEDWMIYDANKFTGQGCGASRSPRLQKITWKPDGTPDFGAPLPVSTPITRPSR